jgi:hypothetical protein
METVRSQRPESMVAGMPQNFLSAGDKTHLNDFEFEFVKLVVSVFYQNLSIFIQIYQPFNKHFSLLLFFKNNFKVQ